MVSEYSLFKNSYFLPEIVTFLYRRLAYYVGAKTRAIISCIAPKTAELEHLERNYLDLDSFRLLLGECDEKAAT